MTESAIMVKLDELASRCCELRPEFLIRPSAEKKAWKETRLAELEAMLAELVEDVRNETRKEVLDETVALLQQWRDQ